MEASDQHLQTGAARASELEEKKRRPLRDPSLTPVPPPRLTCIRLPPPRDTPTHPNVCFDVNDTRPFPSPTPSLSPLALLLINPSPISSTFSPSPSSSSPPSSSSYLFSQSSRLFHRQTRQQANKHHVSFNSLEHGGAAPQLPLINRDSGYMNCFELVSVGS